MEQFDVREVVLTGGYKLVVIHAPDGVYLRLRSLADGVWRFVTPPLPLGARDMQVLGQELGANEHAPLKLEHPKLDGAVNLMIFREKLHVHFGRTQMSGSAHSLMKAVGTIK